jgi:hypothetical protein
MHYHEVLGVACAAVFYRCTYLMRKTPTSVYVCVCAVALIPPQLFHVLCINQKTYSLEFIIFPPQLFAIKSVCERDLLVSALTHAAAEQQISICTTSQTWRSHTRGCCFCRCWPRQALELQFNLTLSVCICVFSLSHSLSVEMKKFLTCSIFLLFLMHDALFCVSFRSQLARCSVLN